MQAHECPIPHALRTVERQPGVPMMPMTRGGRGIVVMMSAFVVLLAVTIFWRNPEALSSRQIEQLKRVPEVQHVSRPRVWRLSETEKRNFAVRGDGGAAGIAEMRRRAAASMQAETESMVQALGRAIDAGRARRRLVAYERNKPAIELRRTIKKRLWLGWFAGIGLSVWATFSEDKRRNSLVVDYWGKAPLEDLPTDAVDPGLGTPSEWPRRFGVYGHDEQTRGPRRVRIRTPTAARAAAAARSAGMSVLLVELNLPGDEGSPGLSD